MNGNQISESLTFLPEDILQEAITPAKKATLSPMANRILQISACFALLVCLVLGSLHFVKDDPTAPSQSSLLFISVHAADLSESIFLQKDFIPPKEYNWVWTNWAPGIPVTFALSESEVSLTDISYQITIDRGTCYIGQEGDPSLYPGIVYELPSTFTIADNSTIFWFAGYSLESDVPFQNFSLLSYADIVIYQESQIIGYAVLCFEPTTTQPFAYRTYLIESVLFTDNIGMVTEEYVRHLIEMAK